MECFVARCDRAAVGDYRKKHRQKKALHGFSLSW